MTPATPRTNYHAVILSPHLDDAVFSCAGTIAGLLQQGPVLVINLFTGYSTELKSRGVVLTSARYQEEAEAAAFLGFDSIMLGELDVSFRRPEYRSLGNIFRPPVQADLDWLPELKARLLALLATLSFKQLYAPLGIGWHVDHVLTCAMLDDWAGPAELLYYEDLPYGLLPHASRIRLAELGLDLAVSQPALAHPGANPGANPGVIDQTLTAVPPLRAWWQLMREYRRTALIQNLRPWPLRLVAQPVVGFYLYRLMALHRQRGAAGGTGSWQASIQPIEAQFEQKLDAMMLYRSQFKEFFLSRDDCENMLRRYARRMGGGQGMGQGLVERHWRRRP